MKTKNMKDRSKKMRKMSKASKIKSRSSCKTMRDRIRVQELQFLMDGGFTINVKGSANVADGSLIVNNEEVRIPYSLESKRIFLSF
jgi:hypothetical protein